MVYQTEALYLNDASLKSWTTEILSCKRTSHLSDHEKRLAKTLPSETFAITTRQTVFYPQGGGQPSDTGRITPADGANSNEAPFFKVLLVRKTIDGNIIHFGEFSPSNAQPCLADGQLILQCVDRARRDYHSRLHTAGHIIGLVMRLLAPTLGERKKTKANHAPGEACMEFEGLLYNEHKPVIEDKVNELVRQKLPVSVSWWDQSKVHTVSLNMVEGLQIKGNGLVRIVKIGEIDASPCGGTHVSHTGLTGFITIRKISRQKGVSRVSYDVPISM